MISKEVADEVAALSRLAGPTIVTSVLGILMNIVDVVMLGHLGREALAAAALGNTIFSMLYIPLNGLLTAYDTFGSQAYGMQDIAAVKYWAMVAFAVLTFALVPITVILNYGEDIVQGMFNQSDDISKHAGLFCKLLIPGLWSGGYFMVIQKYLQVQGNLMPAVWISLMANVYNVAGNYLLIWTFGLGFVGSPIATSSSRFLMMVAMACYALYWERHGGGAYRKLANDGMGGKTDVESGSMELELPTKSKNAFVIVPDEDDDEAQEHGDGIVTVDFSDSAITGLEKKSDASPETSLLATGKQGFFNNCWKFLALGIPGVVMTACESWSFEVATIFAAQLGTVALDAHAIMLSCCSFTYVSLPFGIAIASTIRIGNLVGAGNANTAALSARIAIATGAFVMLLAGCVFFIFGADLGRIFTDDKEVIQLCGRIAFIVGVFEIVDGVQGVTQGVLRGIGRQQLLAILNFTAFWIMGVPSGYLLTFHADMGVSGLWWGFSIGLGLLAVFLVTSTAFINWQAEVDKVFRTTHKIAIEQ